MKEITFSLSNKIELNYGIQILRAILAYLILQFHCYNVNLTKNKILKLLVEAFHFYVPTFYIISYYFSYKCLKLRIISKIQLRIKRIIIPYIIWPIFFFLIQNINYIIYREKKYCVKDLYIQFLTGKRLYEIFWYLCNLILSFILFSIIALLFSNNHLAIIQIIGIIGSLYYPYHFYHKLFINDIKEIRTLIQDFSKVLFYGAIGITLGSLKSINYLKNYRKRTILFCLFILYLIRDFLIIINIFYYLRCLIFGIGAMAIFHLFSMIPLEYIKSKNFNTFITYATNYTGGIYYLHIKIKEILKNKIILIKNGNLIGCFFIYIICYLICFLGIKTFGKTNLKYLFF